MEDKQDAGRTRKRLLGQRQQFTGAPQQYNEGRSANANMVPLGLKPSNSTSTSLTNNEVNNHNIPVVDLNEEQTQNNPTAGGAAAAAATAASNNMYSDVNCRMDSMET